MDVKTAAGQHIMAGLPGTEIDPAFAALVRECKVKTPRSLPGSAPPCVSS